MPSSNPVLLWFRKDLRLDDNLALTAAVDTGRPIVPLYILDEEEPAILPLGGAQRWWLHHSLSHLQTALRACGGNLVLRRGPWKRTLEQVIAETNADSVFFNKIYDPGQLDRERALAERLLPEGIQVKAFSGQLLHDPRRLTTGSGGSFRVYTPFWNAFQRLAEPRAPVDAPQTIRFATAQARSDALDDWGLQPSKPDWAAEFGKTWSPGETAARDKLDAFIETALDGYKAARDLPSKPDATSRLSPHLALGEISPFRVWHATRGVKGVSAEDLTHFRKELVWREFCHHLLFHFPELPDKNWNGRFDALEWQGDDTQFKAWTQGRTGYPIVDAGMRQLWREGIMHNRVRMIAGSFLIKDLLIDWRRGETWFRDTLVDADPASNAANWQWVAGTGADASPFFRVFNPILQGEKFDANGDYVRRYVPELAGLPDQYIHRPFEAPEDVLRKAKVTLGRSYPKPLVEHGAARDRALSAYQSVKTRK